MAYKNEYGRVVELPLLREFFYGPPINIEIKVKVKKSSWADIDDDEDWYVHILDILTLICIAH